MSDVTNAAPRFNKLKVGVWAAWETNMSALLRSKGLMGHATGVRSEPIVPKLTDANETLYITQSSKLDTFSIEKEHCAGEIMLWLEPEEQVHVRLHNDLWDSLKKRHVQERATSRFNAYDDLFSIRLKEGEALTDLAARVKDSMRLVQERRPASFTINQLDTELQVMSIIRAWSGDASCRTLVTVLMHATDLGDLNKLEDKLVTEDLQRKKSPELYDLETSPEGVLLAAGTLEQRANAAAAASSGKGKRSGGSRGGSAASGNSGNSGAASTGSSHADKNVCSWCKTHGRSAKGHTVDSCYCKRCSDMQALVWSGSGSAAAGNAASASSSSAPASASFAAAGEFAGAATAASSSSASPSQHHHVIEQVLQAVVHE